MNPRIPAIAAALVLFLILPMAGLGIAVLAASSGAARRDWRTTPSTPAASAARRIAPVLCGSSTPSSTTMSGAARAPSTRSATLHGSGARTSATTPAAAAADPWVSTSSRPRSPPTRVTLTSNQSWRATQTRSATSWNRLAAALI